MWECFHERKILLGWAKVKRIPEKWCLKGVPFVCHQTLRFWSGRAGLVWNVPCLLLPMICRCRSGPWGCRSAWERSSPGSQGWTTEPVALLRDLPGKMATGNRKLTAESQTDKRRTRFQGVDPGVPELPNHSRKHFSRLFPSFACWNCGMFQTVHSWPKF